MYNLNDRRRAALTDLTFRRRALTTNAGIYARRHAADLLKAVAGARGRAEAERLRGQLAWLGTEGDWDRFRARRLAELATNLARAAKLRRVDDGAEGIGWHADRLLELARQHQEIARLEAELAAMPAWATVPAGGTAFRRQTTRPGSRRRSGT